MLNAHLAVIDVYRTVTTTGITAGRFRFERCQRDTQRRQRVAVIFVQAERDFISGSFHVGNFLLQPFFGNSAHGLALHFGGIFTV
ncbi:hypothetical protein ENROMA047B_24205 [Enterobacter rongchengensis]